jgi:outer membrane lipoprotein SlyB
MKSWFLVFLASSLIFVGCESMGPKTKTGAVVGGLIGATAGGIIGHQGGRGLEGAGIGGAVGAVTGGLVGSSMDQTDKQALQTNPQYIPLTQIADMAQKGTPDAVIINEIERTHSAYHLNSEIITYLKNNKVSDRVIDYMMATGQ